MAFTAVVGAFAAAVALVPQASAASLCMEVLAVPCPEPCQVMIWRCNGYANQKWEMEPEGHGVYQISSGNLCLHVAVDGSDGSPVDLVHCDTTADYGDRWFFLEGQIQSVKDSSKCLDASDPMSAGNWLKVWSCNQQSQQTWGYDSDQKTIYLSDSRRLSEVQSNESYVAV